MDDALLLGRNTYEGFAATWPKLEEVEGDFAARMNRLIDAHAFESGVVALTYQGGA